MKHGTPVSMLLAGLLLMGVLAMGVHSLAGAGTNAGAASSARILLTGLLVMGVFGSCSKDPLESDTETGGPKDGTVRMTFDFTQDFMQSITVKADGAVDENLITDICVLQFNSSGQEVQPPKFISTINTAGDDYRISVDLKAVQGQVWFIANTRGSAFTGSYSLTSMQTVFYEIASESDLTPKGIIPMQGVWKGTPGSSGIPEKVGLKRSLCKVTLNLSGQLPAGDIFKLQSVAVRQVPTVLYYARDDDRVAQYPYPVLDAFATKTIDFSQSVDITYDQNASAEQSFSWLLPENARGIGTAAEPTKKTGDTAPAGQSNYATYIELTGNYTPAGKAKAQVHYRIYLGADNVKDYNLLRGRAYTVNTVIRGVNTADSRLDYRDAIDYTDNASALFGIMPKPASGELKTTFSSLVGVTAGCPEHYRVPGKAEMMIAWVYYNALTDANLYATYATSDRGSNSGTLYTVDITSPQWGGHVDASTAYSSSAQFIYRCVRDLPSSGKSYPYVEYNKESGNYVVVSRDEDGGVRSEALGAGGTSNLVSPKFEVQRNATSTTMTYYAAGQSCPEGWRLPDQREAMLMTALNIKNLLYFPYNSSSGDSFWFYPGGSRIIMSGNSAVTGQMWKNTVNSYGRCIKDVTE